MGGPGASASSSPRPTLRVAATHSTDVHELSAPGRVDAGEVYVGINGSKYGTQNHEDDEDDHSDEHVGDDEAVDDDVV